jgi:hypothetical protein
VVVLLVAAWLVPPVVSAVQLCEVSRRSRMGKMIRRLVKGFWEGFE